MPLGAKDDLRWSHGPLAWFFVNQNPPPLMRTFWLFLIHSLLCQPLLCEAGVNLPPSYFISVDTNDWERPEGMEGLDVSVKFSKSGPGENTNTKIEVSCLGFESGRSEFGAEDLKAFYRISASAGEKVESEFRIMSASYRGEVETTFQSAIEKGEWIVRVKRAGATAIFTPGEAAHVKAALQEAKAGAAWFKLLTSAEKAPEPTPEAHPPAAKGYYLSSTIGEVNGGSMNIEVILSAMDILGPRRYEIEGGITFDSGSTSGPWVGSLLIKMGEAIEAAKAGKNYMFESGQNADVDKDHYYTVNANLKTRQAEVALAPGDFFKDREVSKGHFGEQEMKAIEKLNEEAKLRMKWFEEHDGLFFSPPPEKAGK